MRYTLAYLAIAGSIGCTSGVVNLEADGSFASDGGAPDGARSSDAACAALNQSECEGSGRCHPIFRSDCERCTNDAGCCATFASCAASATADCTGPATCAAPAPPCPGGFAVGYADSCYEGCVGPWFCRPPDDAIGCMSIAPNVFPSFDRACTVDSDCRFGFHQTDCCGGFRAMGFASHEQVRFARDERICELGYQGQLCGCAPLCCPLDDGTIGSPIVSTIIVRCDQGLCTTHAQ